MSLVELIGFLISFISLVFLFFRNRYEQRRRAEHPEEFEQESEEEAILKNLLYGIEEEEKAVYKREEPLKGSSQEEGKKVYDSLERSTPSKNESPKRPEKDLSKMERYRLQSSIEQRRLKSRLESRRLQPSVRPLKQHEKEESLDFPNLAPSRASNLIKQVKPLRHIIVYDAVLGKPKGLQ